MALLYDSIIISKQVNNGLYYVCAKDNVGNVTTDKNAKEQAINVTGIDVEGPKDLRVGVISAAPNYQSLDVLLTIGYVIVTLSPLLAWNIASANVS